MTSYAGGGSGGPVEVVETRVEGSPGELRALARWLRTSLASDLDAAGERQAAARRAASSGWEGEAGAAYGEVGRLALQVTDDQAARTRRAAEVVDDVADRLGALRTTMSGVREEARAGGLVVVGTTVSMPLAHAPGPDLLLHQVPGVLAQRQELLQRIAGDVARARTDHAAWLDRRLARAQSDAAERGDLDGALARMVGGVPGAPPGPGAGGVGGSLAGPATSEGSLSGPAPGPGGRTLAGSLTPWIPGGGSGPATGGSAVAPWAPVGAHHPVPWAPEDDQERAPWVPVGEHGPAPWRDRAPAC